MFAVWTVGYNFAHVRMDLFWLQKSQKEKVKVFTTQAPKIFLKWSWRFKMLAVCFTSVTVRCTSPIPNWMPLKYLAKVCTPLKPLHFFHCTITSLNLNYYGFMWWINVTIVNNCEANISFECVWHVLYLVLFNSMPVNKIKAPCSLISV